MNDADKKLLELADTESKEITREEFLARAAALSCSHQHLPIKECPICWNEILKMAPKEAAKEQS